MQEIHNNNLALCGILNNEVFCSYSIQIFSRSLLSLLSSHTHTCFKLSSIPIGTRCAVSYTNGAPTLVIIPQSLGGVLSNLRDDTLLERADFCKAPELQGYIQSVCSFCWPVSISVFLVSWSLNKHPKVSFFFTLIRSADNMEDAQPLPLRNKRAHVQLNMNMNFADYIKFDKYRDRYDDY